jgi:hypothetical protein
MKTWAGKSLGWLAFAAFFAIISLLPQSAFAAASPSITTQPTNQSTVLGSNAVFTIVTSGQTPLLYQWTHAGTNLADSAHIIGSTSTNLIINGVIAGDAGNYQVTVSNSHGSVTSSIVTLTVLFPARVTSQPTDQAVVLTSNASFTVTASGTAPLSYQWQKDGVNLSNGGNISGTTNATLNLANVQTNDAGSYQVVVTNNYGSTTSTQAALTVLIPANITSQPVGQFVLLSNNITFSATAGGTAPLFYQWYFNGSPLTNNARISGANAANLNIISAQTNDVGSYQLIVTNSYGSAISPFVMLTVLVPASITSQPTSQSIVMSSNATFSVTADGTAPLVYRWYFNGNMLADGGRVSGSTTANLAILNVQTNDAGLYQAIATNNYGSSTSSTATLTVLIPPAISQQPASQIALWGANANFTVAASGTAPLSYQWTFNGNPIAGANNSILILTNLQPSDAGNYAVQVSNVVGTTTSSNATLVVNLPAPGVPFITQFSPKIGTAGTTVAISGTNFSAVAGSNVVYFGAVRAAIMSASSTSLVVTVPSGATYAPIVVTVSGLTAYSSGPFLPTFLGNGSGISTASFGPRQNLATASSPGQSVVADLDGDGKPDLLTPNGNGHTVSIFRNVASVGLLTNSSFVPRIDLPAGTSSSSPYGIAVADVDGDGKPDLIVTQFGDNQVSIYPNISSPGTLTTNSFAPRINFATGVQPQGVVVMDLDGDGRPDIVVANVSDGTISILRNLGSPNGLTTNSFAPRVDIATGDGCDRVVVGDLNGDGKPDLVTANNGNGTVSVLQNMMDAPGDFTTNSFAPKIDLLVPSGSVQVSVMDIDGDGKPDLEVTAYLPQIFSIIQNLCAGGNLNTNSFGPRIDYSLNGRGHSISVGDLDGDSKPDLVVDTELNSLISIFRNVSTPGTFIGGSLATQVELAGGYNSWGSSVCDLDGDGRPDITFVNTYDNNLSFFQNLSAFGGPPQILTQPTNQTVLGNTTAAFSAYVTGQSPAFQWYANGTNLTDNGHIFGSSTSTLTISNTLISDAGNYYLVATNNFGAVTSAVATLTVQIVPAYLTQQPQSSNVLVGKNVSSPIIAGGNPPLNYFWYANGNLVTNGGRISGADTATLTISSAQMNDTATLQVIVTNNYGSVTSSVAMLGVFYPVAITNIPPSQAILLGGNASFSINATGSVAGYQWLLNGSPLTDNARISGSTTPTLTINNIQPGDAGAYIALATNIVSTASSRPATLTPLSNLSPSVRYVAVSNLYPQSPYLDWSTAATNIQDAIDASVAGDLILVTNGIYQTGGRAVYGSISNRVALDKPLTVQSANGPASTFIYGSPRLLYLRGAYLTNGATLAGFTLTNGATYYLQSPGNSNLAGGGVFCESSSAIVSNCVIVGNTVPYYGGGAFGGTLIGCLITNNSAGQGGGACSNILINCTLVKNSATFQNLNSGGGAFYCTLSNCLIVGNSCNGGGGGTFASTLTSCVISNNSGNFGGGVSLGLISNSLISSNRSFNLGGGAYSNTLINCVIRNNLANSGGGAVASTLTGCIVSNNIATSSGGGVYFGTINNSLLSSNRASVYGGGAFSNSVNNCTFTNNFAEWGGAAAYSALNKCTIAGNKASNYGGGIYNGSANNSLFYGNFAGILGIAAYGGVMINCTIVSNQTPATAQIYAVYGSGATNCIVYDNIGGNITSTKNIANTCSTPLIVAGSGNFTNAPLFVDEANHDFHLQVNSPCINSGNNVVATNTIDFDGNPRIVGGTVDIGAYEFQFPTSTLSYVWAQQFGLPTDGSADNADADGDGLNNWQEWKAGTVPTNATSVLQLSSPSNSVSGTTVTWQSVSGVTYYLQRGTNLAAQPPFVSIVSNLLGLAGTTSYTDTSATNGGSYFYRVGVQ